MKQIKDIFVGPLLLDGASGTELRRRGMPEGVCTEDWILEHPEELLDLQRGYVKAGAAVLTAPTFGASPAALGRFGLDDRAGEYNRLLAERSIEAAAGQALVAGDLAPCGMELPPAGEVTFEEIVDNYKVQVRGLKEAGVDLYLCETMTSLAEARAAILAVRETDPAKPLLVSFYTTEEGRLPDGTDAAAALLVAQEMGADAVGLNCAEPGVILAQLERFSPHAAVPLLAMPGFARQPVFEELGKWAAPFAALGVRVLGGCCGTGERHIAALRRALDGLALAPAVPKQAEGSTVLCTGGGELCPLDPDARSGEVLECTDDLWEEIKRAEEAGLGPLEIALLDSGDLARFEAAQGAAKGPLCIWSDIPELMEQGVRLYQGRAFWDGGRAFAPALLAAMEKKYGLAVL